MPDGTLLQARMIIRIIKMKTKIKHYYSQSTEFLIHLSPAAFRIVSAKNPFIDLEQLVNDSGICASPLYHRHESRHTIQGQNLKDR